MPSGAQGGVVESGGLCDVGSADEHVRENVVAGDNGISHGGITFQVSIRESGMADEPDGASCRPPLLTGSHGHANRAA